MVYSHWLKSIIYSSIATVLVLALLNVSSAQVRSSTNYQLQSDSINAGGGFSSSTNYVQESTIGEIATGRSTSTNYSLRAGYQQMQEVFISLSSTGDVTMSPDLPGITGGTANGSSTFTVITDSPSGYQLTIEAENSPAMQSGAYSILDHNSGVSPDFSFTVAASNDARFGFSPQGVDVVQFFLDNGAACGVGSLNTNLQCWYGPSTTAKTISESTTANHPGGATTTVNFRVELSSSAGVIAGVYTATSTVTALPL